MWTVFVLICVICQFFVVNCQYDVPDARVEIFTPKGFRVSIPDEGDVRLFAFHGKINEEFIEREAGAFSVDVLKPANGRWTYYNPNAKLKVGDILYFWTYVIRSDDGRGYARDDQQFEVTELLPRPSTNKGTVTTKKPTTRTTTTPTTTTTTNAANEDACDYTETTVNGQMACGKKIIFNEQFNAFRRKYWNIEHKFAGAPDYEFVVYVNNPQTHEFKDNMLHIKPLLTKNVYGEAINTDGLDLGSECTGVAGSLDCKLHPEAGFIVPPVLSAQLNTKNKFSFKYGKIEITAKLPEGDWLYPELFLTPVREEYGSRYQSGQIRIAFVGGNANLRMDLKGGCILGNSTLARTHEMKTLNKASSWTDNFHKFTVKWRPDSIVLLVDGTVYGTVKPPIDGFGSLASQIPIPHAPLWKRGTVMAPFDKEMYLHIGLGAGGYNFEDRTDGSKPWKNGERLSVKKFTNAEEQWISTWSENSALVIEQIKVWAL